MTQSHSTNITQQVRGVIKVKLIKTNMNTTPNGLIKTGMNSTPKSEANQNRYEQYTKRSS